MRRAVGAGVAGSVARCALLALLGSSVLSCIVHPLPAPRAWLEQRGAIRLEQPVSVRFAGLVDPAQLRVELRPAAGASIRRRIDRLVITPIGEWEADRRYEVVVTGISRLDRLSGASSWRGTFVTRPRVGMEFRIDGRPVSGAARLSARSRLELAFSRQVRPDSLRLSLDGRPLPDASLSWATDGTSASVALPELQLYRPARLAVEPGAVSAAGDPLTDTGPLELTMQATIPANGSSGIGPGFQPRTPLAIVVENSPPARPQAGLQDADIVYEYLSEYQVTRMTAIYFGHVPRLVGPVRSCRPINTYLGRAFTALTLCSGASAGTLGFLFGVVPGSQPVATLMEPWDQGGHFFRSFAKAVPHNLYTTGDRAERLRTEAPLSPGEYAVDPPHDDVEAGTPADPPTVGLHSAGYTYDPPSRLYLRSDHGTPLVDENTGAQLRVKNVVLIRVPFHDAGYVEDDNGGAHAIWYDMLGSGPAEIHSDGRVVAATWHMGAASGQPYWDNRTPFWFTDGSGQPVMLNTGLTWIHVLGEGQ